MTRTTVVAAAALLVGTGVVAAALVLEGDRASQVGTPTTQAVPETAGSDGPDLRLNRAGPSRSPLAESEADVRSKSGAQLAAVSFLELTEDVVSMTPAEAAELQRSISTAAAADALGADLASTLEALRLEVPEGIAVRVSPVAYQSAERAEGWDVSIWYVEVIVYGDQLAIEQWRTARYSLEWEADGWRMSGIASVDGPTPVRTAATVASPAMDVIALVESTDDEVSVP